MQEVLHQTHQNTTNKQKIERNLVQDRKTSVEEEFFMTLVRLRQGLKEEDLAFRMKVSQSSVNRIVTTWISFLSRELAPLIYWPSGEEVKLYYPECFKTYPNVEAIIDCTEVYIQHPSLAEAQALTYSTYKSTNTWITLVSHFNSNHNLGHFVEKIAFLQIIWYQPYQMC